MLVITKKQIQKLKDMAAIQQATTVDYGALSVSCPSPSHLFKVKIHASTSAYFIVTLCNLLGEYVTVISQPGWSTRELALLSVSNRDEHDSLAGESSSRELLFAPARS